MSIASEIQRLQGVKEDIMDTLESRGVDVPSTAKLADVPGLIPYTPSKTSQLENDSGFITEEIIKIPFVKSSEFSSKIGDFNLNVYIQKGGVVLVAGYFNVTTQFTTGSTSSWYNIFETEENDILGEYRVVNTYANISSVVDGLRKVVLDVDQTGKKFL